MLDLRNDMVLLNTSMGGGYEDKTQDIQFCAQDGTSTRITFKKSTKSYFYSAKRVRWMTNPRELMTGESIVTVDGEEWLGISSVLEFSSSDVTWRRLFRGPDTSYSYPSDQVAVRVAPPASPVTRDALDYWRRAVDALKPVDGSEAPLKRPYSDFTRIHPDSVLATVLSGQQLEPHEPIARPIEPFSSNLSQREAVGAALRHRVSVIEGPPGTGKTQTILNLIASIIAEPGTSVGVVSANNSAVENVAEKLQSQGYGFVVAELGKKAKREVFYDRQHERNQETDRWVADTRSATANVDPDEARSRIEQLNQWQNDERRLWELKGSLAAHRHEFERFNAWLEEATDEVSQTAVLAGRPAQRILALLAESQFETEVGPFRTWVRRLSRRIRYGDLRGVDLDSTDDVISLHRLYYERRINELDQEVQRLEEHLESAGFKRLLKEQAALCKQVLDDGLVRRYDARQRPSLDAKGTARDRRALLYEYPVVISTCHSLRQSIGAGTLLDVLIIDEASQLDILAGVLALANCRSVVVVGDQKQLGHIPPALSTDIGPAPLEALDVTRHSVLSSLTTLYGSALPRTLLREHYRCNPTIIQFCNTKYYGGELIPYREHATRGPALSLVRTANGNHMRRFHAGGYLNHREIDSIVEEVMPSLLTVYSADQIGIASPYRRQADVATATLGNDGSATQSDTVHKYQGREKHVMILSTVLDDSWRGRMGIDFVDDPRLVNVAVSRAVERFVLVTHRSGLPDSRHLRDLIGYIEFCDPKAVLDSNLVSIFDLLYSAYATELNGLKGRLRGRSKYPSEDIAWTTLDEILLDDPYTDLTLTPQVLLRELLPSLDGLTAEQASYVRHRASVDFVVRNTVTRQPVLAIEVDGYAFHENKPKQLKRDRIKDSIFDELGLPLLRLPTTGHGEPARIRNALDAVLAKERNGARDE